MHRIVQSILKTCWNGTPGSSQFATSAEVLSVVSQAVESFSREPALLNLTGQFTVVGDIHGHLLSLLRIFQELGWPDSRRYLFLGDYVDRGESSCEVLVLLYCLKILFPNNIFLLRGNHEFVSMTAVYGLHSECTSRFVMKVYSAFVDSFSALPIAAVINNCVFCVHGGIAPELAANLDDLAKLEDAMAGIEADILWADPCESVEGFQRSPRGRSFLFGNDAFDNFLNESDLKLMIRAHENCMQGFDWPFGIEGKLLTVFSAIDYCGEGNDGAVAVVGRKNNVEVVRFPFKKRDRPLIVAPFFVMEKITVALPDLMLAQANPSHLCVEIF
jgi:diadenosine tetraphosphatase ApaH/serine/threonine PP2A family protein phosphatase